LSGKSGSLFRNFTPRMRERETKRKSIFLPPRTTVHAGEAYMRRTGAATGRGSDPGDRIAIRPSGERTTGRAGERIRNSTRSRSGRGILRYIFRNRGDKTNEFDILANAANQLQTENYQRPATCAS
jgi:hypothetical protein